MKDRLWMNATPWPAVLLLFLSTPSFVKGFGIPEPSTVFYGKVTGTGSSRPFLIHEGELTWTIRRTDGSDLALRAPVFPLDDGRFSYRLDVPHSVLALGLEAGGPGNTIPLPNTPQSNAHLSIALDGQPVRIAGPNGAAFDADQASRAATYRLDLEVDLEALDTDEDGLPDWWEDENGLDKQDPDDASGDLDGDGRTNLAEFLAGSNPRRDSTEPTLLTTEILVNADGISGVYLEVDDTDSAASQLVFTLVVNPMKGQLQLRTGIEDPENPDLPLLVGNGFSLDAVRTGRIVYVPDEDAAGGYDSFQISLRDEDSSHSPSSGEIEVHLYRPSTSEVDSSTSALADVLPSPHSTIASRTQDYLLGRDHGYIYWNVTGNFLPVSLSTPTAAIDDPFYESIFEKYGEENPRLFRGGIAADILSGGMANDILAGRRGDDDLFGGGGADLFVLNHPADGHDSILDFSPVEDDAILLSGLFHSSPSPLVSSHLRLIHDGADSVIEVGLPGNGLDFEDLSIRLVGMADPEVTLRSLVNTGALQIEGLSLITLVSIETIAAASENGPIPGIVRVHRDGPEDEALTVNLLLSGAAANGVDFSTVGNSVSIPAGVSFVDVLVSPFVDSVTEPSEVVEISLATGNGYEIDPDSVSTQVAIEDLLPQLSFEVLRLNGYVDSGLPALVLLRRQHVTDRSLFVQIAYSGTASLGGDFTATEFVNMSPGQTTELIQVTPKLGAVLAGGAESVVVEIVANPSFLIAEPLSVELVLSDKSDNFDGWAERNFDVSGGDLQTLASTDPGKRGVSVLERYAFGLNPHAPHLDKKRLPFIYRGNDGRLYLEFHRAAAVTDVEFELEVSSDLHLWQTGEGVFERYLAPWQAGAPGRTAYRSLLPATDLNPIQVRVLPTFQE